MEPTPSHPSRGEPQASTTASVWRPLQGQTFRNLLWGIYRDTEHPDQYLETFLVHSWAEHLRQHERITRADRALEERISNYTLGEAKIRHLIYAAPKSAHD